MSIADVDPTGVVRRRARARRRLVRLAGLGHEPHVRDGLRVSFVVTHFGERPDEIVRAFAIGDHAVIGKHAIMAEVDEAQHDVRTLGWLRPENEGVWWCRGWGKKREGALLAALALARSSR